MGNVSSATWKQPNGNVNLHNMCFAGDTCQDPTTEATSANYKCCRGFTKGESMGLNMCVDITILTNANSYGYTYPY